MKLLVTADETGAIKEVICNRGTDTSKKTAVQPKLVRSIESTKENANVRTRVQFLAVYEDRYLLALRRGGELSIYDSTDDEYPLLHTYNLPIELNDKPIALHTDEAHQLAVVSYESNKTYVIPLKEEEFAEPLAVKLPTEKAISALAQNPYESGVYAFGGNENDLQIVRIYTEETIEECFKKGEFTAESLFTAENVENDWLDMRVPIWITRILFRKAKDGYRLVTTTRYGQLRLYDTTEGPEPQRDHKVCEKPIVLLEFADETENEVILCDTHIFVARLSLVQIDPKGYKTHSALAGTIIRPTAKLLGKYSAGGNTGAIFGVEVDGEIVAMGGLDRYVRVYNVKTRAVLAKVYVGTQISDVVILDTEDEASPEDVSIVKKRRRVVKTEEEEEKEDEEVWRQLEENAKRPKK